METRDHVSEKMLIESQDDEAVFSGSEDGKDDADAVNDVSKDKLVKAVKPKGAAKGKAKAPAKKK